MKGRFDCDLQLESEGTGEDGGQEDSIPADDGPAEGETSTVRVQSSNCDHQVGGGETCW